MSSASAHTGSKDGRLTWSGLLIVLLWGAVFLGARGFLDADFQARRNFAPWVRVLVALAPVAPTALFLVCIGAQLRSLDEMQRQVHLEALAIAFPLAILLLMTLGLLQLAIPLPPEDWSYRHIWPFLPCFYFVGLAIAWRRYR